MEAVLGILVLIIIGLITWWDWENPDKKYTAISSFDAETVRLNNERKDKQIAKIEAKIRKFNEENPGRLFYRVGPRVKEHTPEEVAEINFTKAEYERLNAPYASHQRHYFIIEGELVHAGEDKIRWYKYEEKMRKINRDFENGIHCEFDHRNVKLVNKITKEEIPFDPDEYTLTGN